MLALFVLQTAVIILLAVLVAGLLRSHATIIRQLHDLGADVGDGHAGHRHDGPGFQVQPGVAAPNADFADAHDLAGVSPFDEALGVSVVGTGHHTLIAFLSSGCLTCREFWNALADGRHTDLPAGARLVVVTHGPDEESVSAVRDQAARLGVPVIMSNEAWLDYQVPGSPYFVLVDGAMGRVVGEGSSTNWEQVLDLIGQASDDMVAMPSTGAPLPMVGRGQDRADLVDRELLAAGIHPGHPSLYDSPEGDAPGGGAGTDEPS